MLDSRTAVAFGWLAVALAALLAPIPAVARPLEFGLRVGYYDFDALSEMQDFGLFGAHLGVPLSPWLAIEGSFEEVYTERTSSGNAARQVSFGVHARISPPDGAVDWVLRPSLLVGLSFVIFDDENDPDAYGDAYDIGLGLGRALGPSWSVRADWVLRRQSFSLWEFDEALGESVSKPVALHGRTFRVGVSRAF